MSSLPPSSRYLQKAGEAVDDTEREALAKRLSDAFADGRMNRDDYMASLDTVYEATTLGELVPVVEQLPAAAVEVPPLVESSGSPAGTVSESRNILVPALVTTGAILVLLVILVVVAAVVLW